VEREFRPGRTLARYELLEEVGHGGMAVVYRGRDSTLDREVAIKILHPHLADIPESRARLQREAHAVAKLHHDNILEIFDYSGTDSAESYIVTEFIHGKTLKALFTDRPLPFVELAEMIVCEVAAALEHAHSLGVIHRDVKPDNVMIRNDGLVKLMDFGIAQIVDKERMTVTGQLLGSPAYMAPEHVDGKPLDFRTDVFAVGILLYQLATGQLPFRGKNPHEVLKRIAECKYVPPEAINPRIGNRLGRVIARCLQRDPDQRFADVGPLRKELLEDLADAGVTEPRVEIAAYFSDPDRFTEAFRPRLVSALAARGKVLEGLGRPAAALDLWSRALAVDPRSEELRLLVDGMAQRRQRLRFLGVSLGTIAIAGALAFGVHAAFVRLRTKSVQLAPPAPVVIKPEPIAITVPKPLVPDETSAQIERKKVRPARPPVVVAAPAPRPTRSVELRPTPEAVRVSLDGGPFADYDPSKKFVLDDRTHTFKLESDVCFPQTVSVGPNQTEVPVSLKWRTASLVVHTEPKNASVLVDGIPTPWDTDTPIPVPMNASERKIEVTVSAPGYRTRKTTVAVRANETVKKDVPPLEPKS